MALSENYVKSRLKLVSFNISVNATFGLLRILTWTLIIIKTGVYIQHNWASWLPEWVVIIIAFLSASRIFAYFKFTPLKAFVKLVIALIIFALIIYLPLWVILLINLANSITNWGCAMWNKKIITSLFTESEIEMNPLFSMIAFSHKPFLGFIW